MGEGGESRSLVARLAVAHGMVSPEAIHRVLGILESRGTDVPLGELLLQLGHITSDQFKELMALFHEERRKGESREEQRLFGETVVARGLATPEQVSVCLRRQAELAGGGVFRNLGELLVEEGILSPDQVKKLVEEHDQVIMFCPKCAERYNVLKNWEGQAKCPADSNILARTGEGAGVGVAATLGSGPGQGDSPIGMDTGGCRIVELIARGSMGAVYKAKHVGLNRYVAVKMLPSVSQNPDLIKRLLFEARAVAKLEHPNIVQVYDVGFQKGYFFIVMQLLKGQTLEERMKELGRLPVPLALEVARDVAQGLEAAHAKGIIHRDLKPANIMVTEDGRSRLTDFGLAQDLENPDEKPGLIVGTPYYMSPEQWLGHKADERSDLYSLGVILYQMVTGRRPFEGETVNELMHQHLKTAPPSPKKIDPELSDGLTAMIRKLIAKPPKKRYPSVVEFLWDLKKVVHGEDPEAMAEFGAQVKCGFCESFNPVSEKKCKVCGERLQQAGGPIEIAARPDEFKCPGCGGLNPKSARACADCKKPFCVRCRRRLAVLKGFCHECVPHAKR
jgi:tRNA A-37 threonylcarbamoyl transferase component Bud32